MRSLSVCLCDVFPVGAAAVADSPRNFERSTIVDTANRSSAAHATNAAVDVRLQQRQGRAGRHAGY